MKILDFQTKIADALNAVEALVQGGCKAFAEDTRTVYDESAQFIREGGVAVVVITPDLNRSGSGTKPGVIPFEGDIVIRCMELPPVAASDPNTVRALDAAEIVMHELDGDIFEWRSTRQSASRASDGNDVITATVTFGYTGELTK